ncbi:uncharacterized protein B0H18DRAFT_1035197, partial [Fomitopsis serialis]
QSRTYEPFARAASRHITPSTKLPFAASPPAVARTQQRPRALVVSKSHHRGQTIDGLPVPIIATADDAHQSTSCASS